MFFFIPLYLLLLFFSRLGNAYHSFSGLSYPDGRKMTLGSAPKFGYVKAPGSQSLDLEDPLLLVSLSLHVDATGNVFHRLKW